VVSRSDIPRPTFLSRLCHFVDTAIGFRPDFALEISCRIGRLEPGRSGHRGESPDISPQCLKPRISTMRSVGPRFQRTVLSKSSQRLVLVASRVHS
jgi:hypothetical protein